MNKVELYKKNNEIQQRDALYSLENLAPTLHWKTENNRIMELGSGDGSFTKALKRFMPSNYTILGCDINQHLVNYANEHHRDEQISFTVLDIAGELPEHMKGNFDHVFSFSTLHWVKNQELAFNNIFELLEPGGECFIVFLASHPAYDVFRILGQNEKWQTWLQDCENYVSPYHDVQSPMTEIMNMMEKIGFYKQSACSKKMFHVYENMQTYRDSMAAFIPFEIPTEKQEEFMDEFMGLLTTRSGSNPMQIEYKLLVIYGQKIPSSLILEHKQL